MVDMDKTACLEKLGELFRDTRNELKLTQVQVAGLVGISQGHYCQIENGQRDAEFVTIVKICQTLHVDLTAFISEYM